MNRRQFLKISSAAIAAFYTSSCGTAKNTSYPITIDSISDFAHQIRNAKNNHIIHKELKTQIAIVGAGISGLAAAVALPNQDKILLDLQPTLGGTSSAIDINGNLYSQGAHYELDFPSYYDPMILQFLAEHQIIHQLNSQWKFIDKQFYIDPQKESQSLLNQQMIKELPMSSQSLLNKIISYEGHLLLPTKNIQSKYHDLNAITMNEYLRNENIQLSSEMKKILDYQLIDDFGAGANTLSALAGLHYYSCRPYYTQKVGVFSPPQGNYYFAQKFLKKLKNTHIQLNEAVLQIRMDKNKPYLISLNRESKQINKINAEKVIFAANKHSLPYLYPEAKDLYQNHYAPWLIVNLELKKDLPISYWQNDHLDNQDGFIGFINSFSQYQTSTSKQILTCYFCLPPQQRSLLLTIEKNPKLLLKNLTSLLSKFLKTDVEPNINHAYIKIHGHAMPIAKPGYLFQDGNHKRPHQNITFAGVDNHRLPLFFEAVESGLNAAKLMIN